LDHLRRQTAALFTLGVVGWGGRTLRRPSRHTDSIAQRSNPVRATTPTARSTTLRSASRSSSPTPASYPGHAARHLQEYRLAAVFGLWTVVRLYGVPLLVLSVLFVLCRTHAYLHHTHLALCRTTTPARGSGSAARSPPWTATTASSSTACCTTSRTRTSCTTSSPACRTLPRVRHGGIEATRAMRPLLWRVLHV
jgi:hypothetical protein